MQSAGVRALWESSVLFSFETDFTGYHAYRIRSVSGATKESRYGRDFKLRTQATQAD